MLTRAIDDLDTRAEIIDTLGTGSGSSILQVIDSAQRVTGREVPARRDQRRPGDLVEAVASNVLARDISGWEPENSRLDDIVAGAWAPRHIA